MNSKNVFVELADLEARSCAEGRKPRKPAFDYGEWEASSFPEFQRTVPARETLPFVGGEPLSVPLEKGAFSLVC